MENTWFSIVEFIFILIILFLLYKLTRAFKKKVEIEEVENPFTFMPIRQNNPDYTTEFKTVTSRDIERRKKLTDALNQEVLDVHTSYQDDIDIVLSNLVNESDFKEYEDIYQNLEDTENYHFKQPTSGTLPEEYNVFKILYYYFSRAYETGNAQQIYFTAKEFLAKYISLLQPKEIYALAFDEGIEENGHRVHEVFGDLGSKEDVCLDEAIKKARKEMQKAEEIIQKYDVTKNIVESIDPQDVIVNNERNLNEHDLSELEDIKISILNRKVNKNKKFKQFIALKVMTTQVLEHGNRILELSAIRFVDFRPEKKFHAYICLPHQKEDEIYSLDQIADCFVNFVGLDPIVGFHTAYDLADLYCAGIDLLKNRKLYDAFYLGIDVLKEEDLDCTLNNLAYHYGFALDATSGLQQCYMIGRILSRLIDDALSS